MNLLPLISILLATTLTQCAVLDPALYLAPSPPLRLTADSPSAERTWSQTLEERTERVTRDVGKMETESPTTPITETGRMFWPRYSPPQPALGVHIPLTFSLSGTYGKLPIAPATVIGNTYTSVSSLGSGVTSLFGKTSSVFDKSVLTGYGYGRSGLAGASYGSYGQGVRVYGGDNAASWSGWGNGKWGNYGKG